MTEYLPDSKCPDCGRAPNVSFPEHEVRRARLERQGARITGVRCKRCGRKYWIRAREIARARPAREEVAPAPRKPEPKRDEPTPLPEDFPELEILADLGIRTVDELLAVEDVQELPGIGPARARRITAGIDRLRVAV